MTGCGVPHALQAAVLKESAEEHARLGQAASAAHARMAASGGASMGGKGKVPAAAAAAAASAAASQKPKEDAYAELLASIP